MKTVYFNVLSRLSTELSSTKHPNFVLLAKKKILEKNLIFEFCLLLSNGIKGGMETIDFNVLFHSGTELSTKKQYLYFVLPAKKYFFWHKNWFSNFAYYFQEASQEVWNPFILTFYPIIVTIYLQKTPKFRLLALSTLQSPGVTLPSGVNLLSDHPTGSCWHILKKIGNVKFAVQHSLVQANYW